MAKVIFLHLFFILFTGGWCAWSGGWYPHKALRQTPPDQAQPPDQAHHPPGPGIPPPTQTRHTTPSGPDPSRTRHIPRPGTPHLPDQTPPWTRQTPPPTDQAHSPRTRHPTPPLGSRLRHTVYERPVRILLECIFVFFFYRFHSSMIFSTFASTFSRYE